jgi:hypothetical protein
MATEPLVLEGTWEEIQAHSKELEGRNVRLTVVPGREGEENQELSESNRRMLATMEEWKKDPLTPEEITILEDFPKFRKENPFSPNEAGIKR